MVQPFLRPDLRSRPDLCPAPSRTSIAAARLSAWCWRRSCSLRSALRMFMYPSLSKILTTRSRSNHAPASCSRGFLVAGRAHFWLIRADEGMNLLRWQKLHWVKIIRWVFRSISRQGVQPCLNFLRLGVGEQSDSAFTGLTISAAAPKHVVFFRHLFASETFAKTPTP